MPPPLVLGAREWENHMSNGKSAWRAGSYAAGMAIAAFLLAAMVCRAADSRDRQVVYPQPLNIKSYHLRTGIPGERGTTTDAWIVLPDKERIEAPQFGTLRSGLDYWKLDKKTNRYSARHFASIPSPPQYDKWTTPAGIERMWRDDGFDLAKKAVRRELRGVEQDAIEFDLTANKPRSVNGPWKITLFLDPRTHRVRHEEINLYDRSGKLLRTKTEDYEYDIKIAPPFFKFHAPAGAVEEKKAGSNLVYALPRTIKSFHERRTENGGDQHAVTNVWTVLPDKSRTENVRGLSLRNGLDYWTVNKEKKQYSAGRYRFSPAPIVDEWTSPTAIERTFRDQGFIVTRKAVREKVRGVEQNAVQLNVTGRPDLPNRGSFKIVLLLDAKTQRVKYETASTYDMSGKLVESTTHEFEYDVSVDPALFRFHPPAGFALVKEKAR